MAGTVGIYKMQENLGLKDTEIRHAIEVHTVRECRQCLT